MKIIDGDVIISILNPDTTTSTKSNAPDMNDSSISLEIEYKHDILLLTGDTGFNHILTKYNRLNNQGDTVLKVSHHGSRTGTNMDVINMFNPTHAFISAGNSKNYNHPHKEVKDLLLGQVEYVDISKEIRCIRCYIVSGDGIITASLLK